MNAEQDRIIAEFRGKVVELLRTELSWEKMEATYYRMYRETFTQSELDGMLAFYKTDAGKALIDYFLGPDSMKKLASLGEFVNRKGIYPPLADADKIEFVEMYDLGRKGFAEKKKEYKQIFLQ